MQIGNVNISGIAALAPMAGVADRAFREICKDFGAAYAVGEMASSKGLTMSDRKSAALLSISGVERPMGVQLFGNNPEIMAEAARLTLKYKPDIIDINMGCPAPKVTSNGGGSELMKDPLLCEKIIKSVVDAVDIPVTVKLRKGWNSEIITAADIAKRAEEAGAKAITVHGRTRQQMYAPPVDLDIIAEVKRAVHIPVIGNGDIFSGDDAMNMLEYTGCDMVMAGRGALGAPWLFEEINAVLSGKDYTLPDMEFRMAVMLKHIAKIVEYKGERIGMAEARKHAAWYMKGMKGATALRQRAGQLCTYDDAKRLAESAAERRT